MALVKSGNIGGSSGGGVNYELYADQTGASGVNRTIRVILKLKLAGNPSYPSWFGYPAQWQGIVNGTYSGWRSVKGTESWKTSDNWRSFEWSYTTNVGTTSSKAITVGFQLDSYSGDNLWDTTQTASFSVGSTNTPPSMSGSVTIRNGSSSGAVLNGIIPENITSLYLSWNAGSDNEQGSSGLKYGVNEIINGGGATTVVYPTTSTNATINIGTGNEGQRRKYYVDCRDNTDALSGNRADSVEVTKNTLTGANFTGHSNNIGFDTTSFTLYYSGAKNADGSPCSFLLYSNTVTLYNGTASTSGTQKVDIWRSGATPTGPYVKFDDLKNAFKSNNFNGTLHVGLKTRNNYGNEKDAGGGVSVDLRTSPNPATSQGISTTSSESTAYKKVAFANNYYFIPDGSTKIRVKWSAGSGKLGESVFYELYVAYGSGSWQKVLDLKNGELYYDHVVPKQSSSQAIKYLIKTKTDYGSEADAVTASQTLHYYNSPTITVGSIVRTETTAELPITINTLTSISGVATVGTWSGQGSGNLTSSQTEQVIKLSSLTGNQTYTINITYNDNTGFSSNASKSVAIGANQSVMFLNKYGLGVGGGKANASQSLVVNGAVGENGGLITDFNKALTEGRYYYSDTATNSPTKSFGRLVVLVNDGGTHNNSNNWVWQTVYTTSNVEYRRQKINSGGWTSWVRCYDSGQKPTPSEIGALGANDKIANATRADSAATADNATLANGRKFNWSWGTSVPTHIWGAQGSSTDQYVYRISAGNGSGNYSDYINCIPFVKSDGVMEVGQYIDFHNGDTAKDYSHRVHSNGDGLQIHRGSGGNSNWIGFYRTDGYRYGYIGNGSNSNEYLYVSAGNAQGLMLASDTEYIYTIGNFCPSYTRRFWLGTNSPNWQWKGVCCEGGTVGASDARQKENIFRLDGTQVMVGVSGEIGEIRVSNKDFTKATPNDYYDFMKDRFKPTYFNYKIDESEIDLSEHYPEDKEPQRRKTRGIDIEEERKLLKNVGFLAQDYNLKSDKVAQEFIIENNDGSLLYNHMSYVTVGMIALQEAIKKIEQLEQRVKELEDKISPQS